MRRHASRARCAAWLLVPALAVLPAALTAQNVLTSADIRIHHAAAHARLARSLLPVAAHAPFPGLPADIFTRGDPIDVFIARDALHFDSLTGGRAPEWGAGVAFPERGVIVIPGYVSERTGTHELPQILRHELAHIALRRHLGTGRVPRWFTEGYATWSAGQFDDTQGWMLRVALATGRAPALDSLTLYWPLLETDARTAYMLSASAVRYLHSLGDTAAFRRFLQHWADTGSLEESLRTVYLLASPQFERLWRGHVKRRYGWLQVVAQSFFVWGALSLMVLVLFVVRRRRDRRRLAALLATELPDQPAWWNEPPDQPAEPPGDDTPGEPGDSPSDEAERRGDGRA